MTNEKTRVLRVVRRDGGEQLIFRVRGFYGVLDPAEPHTVIATYRNYVKMTTEVRRMVPKNARFPHEIGEENARNESLKTT